MSEDADLMNVIQIVSDTFRRDHLNAYGDTKVKTPNLDRFSERCVVFDNYYANSFPTVPARADYTTGKFTFTYRGWQPLSETETTVAQILAKGNYLTTAIFDTPYILGSGFNFDRGFSDYILIRGQLRGDQFKDIEAQRRCETDFPAPATMFESERWLQRHYKEKFFLYVDTWDPHEPWNPPAWYVEPYCPNYNGRTVYPSYGRYKQQGVSEGDLELAHACYCGEITMVDRWVGRLLDTIEDLGLMENTAIMFMSDHGFYFGEHGIFGKTIMTGVQNQFENNSRKAASFFRSPLYEEVAHVPLFVYLPDVKPAHSRSLCSAADIGPTIIDFANLKRGPAMQGRSLGPIIAKKEDKVHDFVITSHPLSNPGDVTREVDSMDRDVKEYQPITVTDEEWSLIYSAQGEKPELYRISSDLKQEKDVYLDNRDVAGELHKRMFQQLKELGTINKFLDPRSKL
jgi:arylsulfatase A-like enzyme